MAGVDSGECRTGLAATDAPRRGWASPLALACGPLLASSPSPRPRLAPRATAAPPCRPALVYAPGKIVPIPASIPHEEGDMVDRRIVPDLRWIAQRYPIYVTDGYSGPLPNGEHVGCNGCHVSGSDHYNGLAVDLVPLNGERPNATRTWAPITRLAHWAEPVQNHPRAALPLGRLRRRRRPRLRQPPAPLLEPRPGAPVPARRMGRSLPGRAPANRAERPATAKPPPPKPPRRPARRHLAGADRRRLRRGTGD